MAKRKPPKGDDPVDIILTEYREKLPIYDEFANACEVLVEQLLRHNNIRVHSVTCRPKEVDRLRDKLARPDKRYAGLTDVTDLAGVRIITHLADEVDAVATIIEEEFDIIPEHSIDKRQALDPDRFGYLSVHYVCALAAKRANLAEYAPYEGLVCEIQVRSILQHAWAEIEHDLGYRRVEAIPRQIRRRFSRLAALLETADDDFMRIRDELTDYAVEVQKDIAEKPSEVLLDKVSLETLIRQDALVRRLDARIAALQGKGLRDESAYWLEVYVDLFRDQGIDTVQQLREALTFRENVILKQANTRLKPIEGDGITLRGISLFHLWQVILTEGGDVDSFVSASDEAGVDLGPDPAATASDIMKAIREASAEVAPRREVSP